MSVASYCDCWQKKMISPNHLHSNLQSIFKTKRQLCQNEKNENMAAGGFVEVNVSQASVNTPIPNCYANST